MIFLAGLTFDKLSDTKAKMFFIVILAVYFKQKYDWYEERIGGGTNKSYILGKSYSYRAILFSVTTIQWYFFMIIVFKWTSKKWYPLMISLSTCG